ncbi:N-6 DNA methylase [Thermococcus sp. SY098]|uniref:N-6 DNA methylase n=1 Tax=Thermococcus sp. SY098 TaxID=3111325 RepID=UPI002D799883|nr:N-6 DNA methylase [Thermococcus sp. SY098]WRS52623.1 N-6 DNA methylase [Thermococcus sp. SY098]
MNLPQEDTVNVYLAEILGSHLGEHAKVVPEKPIHKKGKRRRFDIKIEFRGIEFILEASYDEKDAEADAIRRLEEGLIDTVSIAVHYPPELFNNAQTPTQIKKVLIQNPLKLKVFTQGRDISGTLLEFLQQKRREKAKSVSGWIYLDINEFGTFLESIVELVVKEDILEDLLKQIEEKVNTFVSVALEELENSKIKASFLKDLNRILFSPAKEEDIEVPEVPDEVLLSHAYISLLMASTLYESVSKKHGLRSLQVLLRKNEHPLLAMEEGFTKILEVDYENVFDVALGIVRILFDLQSSDRVMATLEDLIEYVSKIVRNKALLRQDFIGYIYHKVTGDIATRKGYATFYTKAPIATFLANLALYSPNDAWENDWGKLTTFKNFRVCDFACGSGTLLSATYSSLLSKYRKNSEEISLDEFHKIMIENSIWGFDALEHAVQTASVVLSLHEPEIPLEKMNTYHIPVDESGSLGSLNLWNANSFLLPLKRRSIGRTSKVTVWVPKFDFIIMNPPFSRTTAPGEEGSRPRIFDFVVSEEGFRRLWERYRETIDSMEEELLRRNSIKAIYDTYVGQGKVFLPQNVNPLNAGAALPFIILADRYLKPYGRMALVLPKTVIESSAFFLVRALITSGYELEYIVVSAEPGNYNFSYSTQLSEVLLVLKKLKKGEKPIGDTYIIKFLKQPRNNLEGLLMARTILDKLDGSSIKKIKALNSEAEIYKIKRKTIEDFVWNWSILTDLPPSLVEFIGELLSGKILGYKVNLTRILDLRIELKVTNPRKFRGANLKKYFEEGNGQFRILKRTGKSVMNRLSLDLSTTEKISPKKGESVKVFRESSGHIIIPESIRFNTYPLLAVYSSTPLISGAAFVGTLGNSQMDKAFVAWLNSSYAILYLKPLISSVEGNFGHLRGWHLRTLPVPDLTNEKIVKNLAEVFENYKEETWKPLPKQYEDVINGEDDLRERYDLDILKAITDTPIDEESFELDILTLYIELLKILR